MKKLFLILVACIQAFILYSNPVAIPLSSLHAFYFGEDQHWKMELAINITPDSILISSSSGRSLYTGQMVDMAVITKDSLRSVVSINPTGDSVTIVTYFTAWDLSPDSLTETFVFGNYRNAMLPCLLKGQFITRILESYYESDYHCVCDSLGNTKGILRGSIYDKEKNLITSGSFNLSPFPVYVHCAEGSYQTDGIDIQADGTYSTSLYNVKYAIGTIQICYLEMGGLGCQIYRPAGTLKIDSLEFIMRPDTTISRDLHLKDDFVGLKREIPGLATVMNIFPNPVIHYGFHYQVSIPVKSTQCFFELINAKGQVIWHTSIDNNTGDIILPSDIPGGLYYLHLRSKARTFCSSQLAIKR
ncbi:MAG: T9SS type A sorting domain-containing protein [Bacteroidales bacterium]|nr:T9SS type A sorting domain-containing protein [Bacteroidales bacterium]